MPRSTDHNPNAFKHFFNKELLQRLSKAIVRVYPSFDSKRFIGLMPELQVLEMKPRVQFLREALRKLLPQDYPQALEILLKSTRSGTLKGFDCWPYSDFIQTYGLDHLEISLDALKELTPIFSSEFAVRPFLKLHAQKTLKYLMKCSKDPSVDVRRWASEGSRPRLPWGERLHDFVRDPSPTLEILEQLKFDPELYVRKSVSNHLNDITKDHPERVIATLKKWKKLASSGDQPKIDWIIHRALRSLIKAGHPEALELIGVSHGAQIKLKQFKMNTAQFKLGERIEFEFVIQSLSSKAQNLVIDYVIHFVKANQKTTPKVFKLKKVLIPGDDELSIQKAHHLKKVTTRVYYSGVHFLEIQINGKILKRISWELFE